MIEDVEEGVLGLGSCRPLLDIVHDKHVYRLIETDKIIELVLAHGIGILYLKEVGTHIEHPLLGIELACTHAYGIDKVCLAAS